MFIVHVFFEVCSVNQYTFESLPFQILFHVVKHHFAVSFMHVIMQHFCAIDACYVWFYFKWKKRIFGCFIIDVTNNLVAIQQMITFNVFS